MGTTQVIAGAVAIAAVALVAWVFLVSDRAPPAIDDELGGGAPSPSIASSTTNSDIPDLGPHPPLLDHDGWLQSPVASLEELRGTVVIVHMWTFGCINCKRTLPNLQQIYASHAREDLEIVGVHAPEFDDEKDIDSIEAAADDLGVTWPILLDTDKRTFRSWQGRPAYWPRTFVLDREGRIRFDHIGEGAYEELREVVATLVAG